jgi:fused signal recognition particle receptor
MSFFKNLNFDKLVNGLSKTKDKLVTLVTETITGKAKVDESTLDELEEILVTCDIGYETASKVIENARREFKKDSERSKENLLKILKTELKNVLVSNENIKTEYELVDKFKPFVILIVGVNGAGKTTTIGKLAHNYKQAGLKVVIGSADTFRAAANEQLEIWAKRAGVEIIMRAAGSDPSSVAFDTISMAKKQNADIVIIDTAGRLHTKHNLMEELKKIKKVMGKVLDYAPNEVFLVVDGNTGQNALIQAQEFSKYTELTGLIVTKLDGTAKGGVLFQISAQQNIPVRYIGVGEGIEDLQTFDADSYVNALFGKNN